MQTEQLLCWSGMTDTEHGTTSGSNEEEEEEEEEEEANLEILIWGHSD